MYSWLSTHSGYSKGLINIIMERKLKNIYRESIIFEEMYGVIVALQTFAC